MGERFTYVFLTAFAIFAVACGSGDSVNAETAAETDDAASTSELPQAPLPDAPQILRVTPGDGTATIDWSAAGPDDVVSSYLITGIPDGSRSVPGDALTARVAGLTNGQEYSFTVRAINESGFGPDSSSSGPVLIAAPPGPPPAVAATELLDGGVRLAWFAPARDGGSEIVTYIVNSETEGAMRVLEGRPVSGYVLDGEPEVATRPGPADTETMVFVLDLQQPLQAERFRVAAANQLGLGQWSSWTMTEPAILPASDTDAGPDVGGEGQSSDPDSASEPAPGLEDEPSESPSGNGSTSDPDVGDDNPVATPTPEPDLPIAMPTPTPPAGPGAVITVEWLPTLYGADGPPPGWLPTILGTAGVPFLLDSVEAWSTDPVDVFRGDIDWGDGTADQAWFEDPVYISSRNADGVARLFAYHTYAAPGRYPVTITVSAINHSGVVGETAVEAFIDQ